MEELSNSVGITIKQLKELVKDLPETNQDGEDYEVWIEHTEDEGLSSVARCITRLNEGDIIFSINTYE